jgi:uncharacterized protein (TIGR03545 family)
MTTSTENNSNNPSDKKSKKVKKQGPIRTGLVIPVLVVCAALFAYTYFFLDSHLRFAMEYGGTQIHGAQVDVRSVKISFLTPSIEIRGIQVTDKEKPELNLVQIEQVKFSLLWDALLRAKFVSDEVAVTGLGIYGKRKSPGKILPPPPPPKKDDKPGMVGQATEEVKAQALIHAKEEFDGNALGSVADILGGSNVKEQVTEIRDELEAEKYLNQLEEDLKAKEKFFDEKIKSLPKKEEAQATLEKIKAIKLDKNPLEAAKQLKALKGDIEKIKDTVKTVKSGVEEINKSVDELEQAPKKLEELIEQDIQKLQSRLAIPSLDTKDLAKGLFGRILVSKLGQYAPYLDKVRAYLPPKKSKEDKEREAANKPTPRPRATGADYDFPITGGYPAVWFKRFVFSSQFDSKEASDVSLGNIKGLAENWTTNPRQTGKPMTLKINGDFPAQKIYGMELDFQALHHQPQAIEILALGVKNYPVSEYILSKSEKLTFGINRASGGLEMNLKNADDGVLINWKNRFTNPDYLVESTQSKAKEILSNVVREITMVTLNANAAGPWNALKWNIDSNLGQELGNGLKKELGNQLNMAKAKVQAMIDEKIGPKKAKIEKTLKDLKEKMKSLTAGKEQEIAQIKDQAESSLDTKSKEATGGAKDEAKDKLKDTGKSLLKKFKL